MSEIATSGNLIHRIRYTPMRDVLRGRFSGRLEIRQLIGQSALPDSAQRLIRRVIRRTQLRSLEKADVANELIAHFVDGLESGRTVERLISAFGDERQAARLITRAKRRNRSMFARAQTIAARAIAFIVVTYAVTAVYYFSGRPGSAPPSAKLNDFARRYPESERAWPIYFDVFSNHSRGISGGIERIREAAKRPVVGVSADASTAPERSNDQQDIDFRDIRLVAGEMAHRVILDMRDGRKHSDSARWLADFDAARNMCRQWHADPAVSSGQFDFYLFRPWMLEISQATSETPTFLNDDQLRHIAGSIVSFQVAGDLLNPDAEEVEFNKWLNRTYTSGEWLPGRMTPTGLEGTMRLTADLEPARDALGPGPVHYLLEPMVFLLAPSRGTVVGRFEEGMKQARQNLALPRRSANWSEERPSWISEQLDARVPILSEMNRLGRIQQTMGAAAGFAEYALGKRDGVLIGIALELFYRHNRRYPASLDQLYPAFVGEKIVDRITGGPLHYHLVDGQPLVYSVGGDRKDDSGRVPLDYYSYTPDPTAVAVGNADGDWVIYPLPQQ